MPSRHGRRQLIVFVSELRASLAWLETRGAPLEAAPLT
jgi:hypothetical protein